MRVTDVHIHSRGGEDPQQFLAAMDEAGLDRAVVFAGFRDDVFLQHQTAHIIRPKEHRQLPDLQTLRYPTRLDIGKVVQIETRHGLCLEILKCSCFGYLFHVRVFRLKCPADKGRETACLVLQLT